MAHRRVFSGIQPTGVPHLGNYLGAIQNWVRLQDGEAASVLYCVVDLHALTVPRQQPAALQRATRGMAAALLACGVDPKRSVLFQQSTVPEHAELAWLLACHTPLGWLRRMTQFKAKAGKLDAAATAAAAAAEAGEELGSASILTGLLTYPTLMAADILLYGTTHVPVGEDQVQHVELTREIARAMNGQYGASLFPLPQALLGPHKRVMSLRDASVKMSKSDENDMTRINLDDSPDQIVLKIRRAKTDSLPGLSYDPECRPEVSNLLNIYASVAGLEPAQVVARLGEGTPASRFKEDLAALLVSALTPIRDELARLERDSGGHIDAVLRDGAVRARELAAPVLAKVRNVLGLYTSR